MGDDRNPFDLDRIESLFHQENIDMSNSYKNWHAKDVYYLCLGRSENLTIKLYRIPPKSHVKNLNGMPPDWLVAPHTHRYDFDTMVLRGSIRHLVFDKTEDLNTGFLCAEHQLLQNMVSMSNPGPGATFGFKANFRNFYSLTQNPASKTYHAGQWYSMERSQIHTIAPTDFWSLLLVFQYQSSDTSTKIYLAERDQFVSLANLYFPMLKEEATTLLSEAKESLRRLIRNQQNLSAEMFYG